MTESDHKVSWSAATGYTYDVKCQYCGTKVGVTSRVWATEGICHPCARFERVQDAMEHFGMIEKSATEFVRLAYEKEEGDSLTFDELRRANLRRSPKFKNARGVVNDSDKTFTLSGHMTALVGEVGEAANIIKKIARGDFGLDDVFEDETERESGWLIEYNPAGGALYWDGLSSDGDSVANGWTVSPGKAVRFCRESDAVAIIRVIREYGCVLEPRATEHMRIGPHKSTTVRDALAKEIADAQCYLDKLAHAAGIDLGECTRKKFNEVSERVGSDVKL